MKIKTKLWGITIAAAITLALMIVVVYFKGRETVINLANMEARGTADRTALLTDVYLEKMGTAINNIVPLAESAFNPDGTMNPQRMQRLLASALKQNTNLNVVDIYVGDNTAGKIITATGFIAPADFDSRKRPWFEKAITKTTPVFTDPYIDLSSKKLIVSISQVIHDDKGKLLGVAGIDVDLTRLQAFVIGSRVFEKGFGALLDTQGNIVIHPDSNLVMQENATRASNRIPENMARAGQQMMQGTAGSVDYIGSDGAARRTFYAPLPSAGFTFFLVMPIDEMDSIIMGITLPQLIGGVITTIAVLLLMFFTIPSITKPINGVAQALSRLASLDLTPDPSAQWIEKQATDKTEIGEMVASLIHLRQEIGDTMARLKQSVDNTTSTARNLEDLTHKSNTEAESSKESVHFVTRLVSSSLDAMNHANRSVEEVSHAANMTATSATEGAEASSSTATISQSAVNGVQQFIHKLSSVEKASQENSQSISEVGSSVTAISEFVNTIRNIASQTNLLALNAAIEAARAGEAGRGFAVVADEVRKLAEESNVASHQVAELIEKLQNNTNASINATQQSTQVISEVIVDADKTQQQLREALDAIGRINDSMQTIAAAAQEQAASSNEIAHSINQVTESTQELSKKISDVSHATDNSVAAMSQVSREAERLAQVSEELQHVMDRFVLDESSKHGTRSPRLMA